MKAVITIKDRKAAAVFDHARQRRILMALMEKEWSLGKLAAATQTSLPLLHHHMRRFLEYGLVQILKEKKARRGPSVKLYRASAQMFFVPARLLSRQLNADWENRLRAALERARMKAFKGVEYTHDGRGPRMRMVTEEGADALSCELWVETSLGPAEAAALLEELRALIGKYRSSSGKAGGKCILHAALARL